MHYYKLILKYMLYMVRALCWLYFQAVRYYCDYYHFEFVKKCCKLIFLAFDKQFGKIKIGFHNFKRLIKLF